jgi:hypothetical protein
MNQPQFLLSGCTKAQECPVDSRHQNLRLVGGASAYSEAVETHSSLLLCSGCLFSLCLFETFLGQIIER